MAITNTTLAAACAAGDQSIKVTSATGFAVGGLVRIDSEFMVITSAYVAASTTVPVLREGQGGSSVQAHSILAPVAVGLTSDSLNPAPGSVVNPAVSQPQMVSYGADGAITPPTYSTIVTLNKATAAAMTLVSPSGIADGTLMTILSTTAAAHTVTYTPGFYGDTTSSDVALFAAKVGASATFIACRGLWGVYALANVTLG
jgi:hypothetical protein